MDTRPTLRTEYGSPPNPVDNSWAPAVAPWNWEMTHDDNRIRVLEDFTAGQVVEFEKDGDTLHFQPMELQWTNDLGQIEAISMPQNVVPVTGSDFLELNPGFFDDCGYIRWNNGYGPGIDFQWQCRPGTLEKRLRIDALTDLPVPAPYIIAGGNPVLRLNMIFDPTGIDDILVNGQVWDEATEVQTFDVIQFRKAGQAIWHFKPLRYWCSDDGLRDGESVATVSKSGNSLYISILVPYSWLQTAVYPVFIDADVTIDAAAYDGLWNAITGRAGPHWTSTTTAYVIYIDSSSDLVYQKTGDGGDTWDGVTNIKTGTIKGFDTWADWQTAGDAGTKIHMAYYNQAIPDVGYIYLDTNTDTVGGDDRVDWILVDADMVPYTVSITKSRGGQFYIVWALYEFLSGNDTGFYTSPDAATWTLSSNPMETYTDLILLFAGNEIDPDDIWAAYWDDDADELSLKTYDDSGNSWSEQSISGSIELATSHKQFDGQIRLSDGHLILVAWSELNTATADLKCWDINGAGSITAKTDIIQNTAEYAICSVMINQINDDIYVAYVGGTDYTSLVKCFYQTSDDGGGTWGGQTAMQADAEDDERWLSAGSLTAANGGKFLPFWFNDDLDDIFCNTDNAIDLNPGGGATLTNKSAFMAAKLQAAGII